jgi:hypothetical protein
MTPATVDLSGVADRVGVAEDDWFYAFPHGLSVR